MFKNSEGLTLLMNVQTIYEILINIMYNIIIQYIHIYVLK